MEDVNKIPQIIGIPHSALLSIIFGMMIISFPLGAYVVFNTNIGDSLTYEYPLNVGFLKSVIPFEIQLGDAFIVLWSSYVVLFTVGIFGPKHGFLNALTPILLQGKSDTKTNYMIAITKWFSILILVSTVINLAQERFDIIITPPVPENNLLHFFTLTLAPLTEELGFRLALIGVPLFAIYAHKASVRLFLTSLWYPQKLDIFDIKKPLVIIITVGIFFGLAHIFIGESWSDGKFLQAAASGIILGWIYFRFGLLPAIIIHWATNYFLYSYGYFISEINQVSIQDAFLHSLLNTMEIMFIISGILSVAIIVLQFLDQKRKKRLAI